MKFEVRTSLVYLLSAIAWIVLSDAALSAFAAPGLVHTLQTYKGVAFVTITSLLLFALLRQEAARRQHSEKATQQREVQLRYLFLNNPLPMWVYDLETLRFLDVNDAAVDQYGYSRDTFLSMRITDIRPSEDIPRLMETITRDRPPLQHSGLWRHHYQDGSLVDVEIVSHRLKYDGCDAALVVAQNVTERLKTQAALGATNEMLQALFRAAPLAIFRFSADGTILTCNPAAEQMFGWSAAEMIGHDPPFVPAERGDEFFSIIQSALAGTLIGGIETRRRRKDGSFIDVSIYGAPVRDASGAIQEVMSVVVDVTERKQMEAERLEQERLRLALNKEIELRSLRSRFMSMASHEFRGPLAVIASSSGLLERYYERMTPDSRSEHFSKIQTQVRGLTEMIEEILLLLRAESLGPEFRRVPLDLLELCTDLVAETQLQAGEERAIELLAQVSEAPIEGDPKLLRHAIGNLLTNAVKYSQPKSIVRLELLHKDETYRVRVQDEGIGIPAESISRLYEPFYRADNVGTIPGSGLGLAIARQAAELHSGWLEVDSELGRGSTFTLCLPDPAAAAAPRLDDQS